MARWCSSIWHVGQITALKYQGSKWAKYPALAMRPKPGNKKQKAVEYSHLFNEADYNKLWMFVRERPLSTKEADAVVTTFMA